MGLFAALASAAVPAIAGIIGGKQKKKDLNQASALAQFTPFDVSGLSSKADITFDPKNPARNKINLGINRGTQAMFGGFLDQGQASLAGFNPEGDASAGAFGDFFQRLGGASVPGLFGNVLRSPEGSVGFGANALRQGGLAANQMGQLGNVGAMQGLFGGPSAQGLTGLAAGAGAGLLGTPGAGSFNDIAAERLRMLREGARPDEERAVNSKMQQLFSTGRLGTTGGARAIESMALGEERADIERQLGAQGFAEQLRGRDMQDVLDRLGIGSNLLGQGFQGIGLDQRQALSRGQIGSGLLSGVPGAQIGLTGAATGMDNATLNRGQSRLQSAQGLFGFGQMARDIPFQRAMQSLAATQSIEQSARATAALGLQGGANAATAGANASNIMKEGAGSPFMSALQGFGQSAGGQAALGKLFSSFG